MGSTEELEDSHAGDTPLSHGSEKPLLEKERIRWRPEESKRQRAGERKRTQTQIAFDGADEDAEETVAQEPSEARPPSSRRIWGKKGSTTSKALYEIAAKLHRLEKGSGEQRKPAERTSKHNVEKEARELLKQMKHLSTNETRP